MIGNCPAFSDIRPVIIKKYNMSGIRSECCDQYAGVIEDKIVNKFACLTLCNFLPDEFIILDHHAVFLEL